MYIRVEYEKTVPHPKLKIMVSEKDDDDTDEDGILHSLYEQYRTQSPDLVGRDYDATIIDGSENDEWLTLAQHRRGENDSLSSSGIEEVKPLLINLHPTRRRAVSEFMWPVTVFFNKKQSRRCPGNGNKHRWEIERILSVGVTCVEIPAKWVDGRQLVVTFLLSDMSTSEPIALKVPTEWSARVFLLLLVASIGDTFIKEGVISCHLDREKDDGNDMNTLIASYGKKEFKYIESLTDSSEYNSTVNGGVYNLRL